MGLGGRHEVVLHAEVDAQVPVLEPAPAPDGEVRRLGYAGDAEHALVEPGGQFLAPGGMASWTWSMASSSTVHLPYRRREDGGAGS